MPYIKPHLREALDPYIDRLVGRLAQLHISENPQTAQSVVEELNATAVAGSLNYVLTRILMGVLAESATKPGYASLAVFSGVLSHMSSEFYRRVVVPYEEAKIAANGDVPEFKS
jgi:hypothetical protein